MHNCCVNIRILMCGSLSIWIVLIERKETTINLTKIIGKFYGAHVGSTATLIEAMVPSGWVRVAPPLLWVWRHYQRVCHKISQKSRLYAMYLLSKSSIYVLSSITRKITKNSKTHMVPLHFLFLYLWASRIVFNSWIVIARIYEYCINL